MTETQSLPDLIQPHERQRRRHKKRFRTLRRLRRQITRLNWLIVLIVVMGIGAVIAMSALVLTLNARNRVDDSWSRLNRVWSGVNSTTGTELTLNDFDRLQTSVIDFQSSLVNARRQTSFLRPFSPLSADLDTTLRSLDAAQQLTFAANDILTGMQPALFFLTEGESSETIVPQLSSGERVVELLDLGRGRFLSANQHLDSAQALIDDLNLPETSPNLMISVDGMTKFQDQLQEINSLLLDSPDLLSAMLGLTEQKTYLVLSQNSDELRPSGGYISTYGWVAVRSGRILEYDYRATTSTSPNPPDESMASEVQIPDWWIQYSQPIYAAWDSSWYADFPSTAEMAMWFYDNGGNPQSPVDGVIGMDLVGFEYILEGLGSVTVPGYNIVVTPDTFREEVYKIRAEGEGDTPHKKFLAALYKQILEDWQSADQEQSIELRGSVLRALQEKHIMLYFKDADLNNAARILNWAGAQDSGIDQDYLMVADANLGSKSNHSIIRQLTYDVEIQPDGSLQSRAAVAYDYSARVAEKDPAVRPEHYSDINYNNLLQVYVPANSVLTGTANLNFEPEVVNTAEHTSFVTRTRILYNQSDRFQYTYTTPILVETFGPYHRYRLQLQKQPGMLGEQVNVQVTLPAGASVVSNSPDVVASYNLEQPILEFRIELVTDQTIEIIFRQ